jgi:hypothetical protein
MGFRKARGLLARVDLLRCWRAVHPDGRSFYFRSGHEVTARCEVERIASREGCPVDAMRLEQVTEAEFRLDERSGW